MAVEPKTTQESGVQVKKHTDMSCNTNMMPRAYCAVRSGDQEGFKEECGGKGEISEWAFAAYARIVIASLCRLAHGGCHRVMATTERKGSAVGDAQLVAAKTSGEHTMGFW